MIALLVLAAVWLAGTALMAVCFVVLARHHPQIGTQFVVAPVAACLMAALVCTFWPSALIATALLRATERGHR